MYCKIGLEIINFLFDKKIGRRRVATKTKSIHSTVIKGKRKMTD